MRAGMRLAVPLVGLTLVGLAGCSGGALQDTARFSEDLFQGSGSTGPFDLRFQPLLADGARAVVNGKETIVREALLVLVDGVEQQEGADYDVDREIGRIIFRRIVPPTAVVRVRYYYQLQPTWRPAGVG